jgi:hypothetical protein
MPGIDDLARDALALAVARYLRDHPEAADRASNWLNSEVETWRGVSSADIEAEATARLDELERWREAVKSQSEAWEADRVTYVHAKLTLQSARSGSFETAAGSLLDFLRDVGANAEELDIH